MDGMFDFQCHQHAGRRMSIAAMMRISLRGRLGRSSGELTPVDAKGMEVRSGLTQTARIFQQAGLQGWFRQFFCKFPVKTEQGWGAFCPPPGEPLSSPPNSEHGIQSTHPSDCPLEGLSLAMKSSGQGYHWGPVQQMSNYLPVGNKS